MSNENQSQSVSAGGNPSSVAEQYIQKQLEAARASVSRSRTAGIILAVVVCGYFGGLTWYLKGFLEPEAVADVTMGLASGIVNDKTAELSARAETEARNFLRGIPDEVIRRMPEFRRRLEVEINESARRECGWYAKQLGEELDDYIVSNKEHIRRFVEETRDPAAVRRFAHELGDALVLTLSERTDGGTTVAEKISVSQMALERIEAELARLAQNKGLDEKDQNKRRAIAILVRAAENSQ